MTSLVGHGDVTSADVIGEDVAADDRSKGGEVAVQSAVSWTRRDGQTADGRRLSREGYG